MTILVRIRVIAAMLLFLLMLMTAGGADLYANVASANLRGEKGRTRRMRFARWQRRWLDTWMAVATGVGGMRIRYEREATSAGACGPFIIVANHFGAFDGVIVYGAAMLYGQTDLRPVVASYGRHIPVMGRAWKELGIAFVRDHHPEENDAAIRAAAAIAAEDGASMIIFPTGWVLTRAKAVHGGRTLLPAKAKGVCRLTQELPRHATLSLTVWWRDYAPYALSDRGIMPPGADLRVECRALPPPGDDAAAVLAAEWERKAEWLRTVT